MLDRRVCFVLFVLLVSLGISGGPVEAECARSDDCRTCTYQTDPYIPGKEAPASWGSIWSPPQCWPSWPNCVGCDEPLASDSTNVTSGIILETVASVPVSELSDALTDDYRNRLLLHPSRSMLAVLDECDGHEVTAIVFLSPDKVRALGDLGLRGLEEFLAQNEVDS